MSLSASVAVTGAPTSPDVVFSATVRVTGSAVLLLSASANSGSRLAASTSAVTADAVWPVALWVVSV